MQLHEIPEKVTKKLPCPSLDAREFGLLARLSILMTIDVWTPYVYSNLAERYNHDIYPDDGDEETKEVAGSELELVGSDRGLLHELFEGWHEVPIMAKRNEPMDTPASTNSQYKAETAGLWQTAVSRSEDRRDIAVLFTILHFLRYILDEYIDAGRIRAACAVSEILAKAFIKLESMDVFRQ